MGNLQSSFDTDWPYEEHELKFPVVRDGSVTLKHFLEAIQISTSDLAEKYKWSTRGNLQCQVQETMWLPHQSDEREYKEFEKLKDTIAKFYAEDGESNKEKLQDAITKFMQAFPPKQRQIALRIRAYPLALDKYMTWDNFTEYTRQAKAWEEQEARKKHDLELRQTKGSRKRQVLKRNKGGGGGGGQAPPLSLAQLKEKKQREKEQKEDAERVRLLELEQEEKEKISGIDA